MDKVQENVVKRQLWQRGNDDDDHFRQLMIIAVLIIRDRMDKGAAGKCSEEATTGGKNWWKGNDEDTSRQLPPVFL